MTKIRQYVIFSLLSFITNFNSAFTNSVLEASTGKIDSFIHQSLKRRGYIHFEASIKVWQTAIFSSWFVAQLFGVAVTPGITDRYGRKVAYLISLTSSALASALQILSITAESPELLVIGRIAGALVCPLANACLVLYIQESSSVDLRGSASYLCELGYWMMWLAGATVGAFSSFSTSLADVFIVQLTLQSAFIFFFVFIPETPKYLFLTREKRELSERSMNFFQGTSHFRYGLLNEINVEAWTEEATPTFWEMLRTLHLRNALIVATAILVPTMSLNTMTATSRTVFKEAGATSQETALAPLLILALLTFSTACGTTIIDLYPRRLMLLATGTGCSILLVLFAIFTNIGLWDVAMRWPAQARLATLMMYTILYGVGIGPLSWFLGTELVSQRHRSTMFASSFAVKNLLGAATTVLEETANNEIGTASLIIIYVIPAFLALLYLYFHLPETQSRESAEIVNQMASRGSFLISRNESVYSISASMYSSISIY